MSDARTTKGTTEERVQRFAALLDQALPKIESTEPIKGIGKVSPVEAALLPMQERIRTQLDRGYKAGTIARIIKESDELDDTFAQETIRLAILRLAGNTEKSKANPQTKARRDAGKHPEEAGRAHGREPSPVAPTETDPKQRPHVPSQRPSRPGDFTAALENP